MRDFHAVLYVGGEPPPITEHSGDVTYVKEMMPDEKYKIMPLREAIRAGNLRPQFGDMRVFVFNEFDSMSEICQNALLKFIEEPHEYNRFVMRADSTAKILPTVLSRVALVRCNETPDLTETPAQAIADSIKSSIDEYTMLAEFSRVKDRATLNEVLRRLLSPDDIDSADILYKYINRMEYNPNIPVTVACITAELSEAKQIKKVERAN